MIEKEMAERTEQLIIKICERIEANMEKDGVSVWVDIQALAQLIKARDCIIRQEY